MSTTIPPTNNSVAASATAASSAARSGPVASTLAKTTTPKSTQSAGVAVSVSTLARSMEASNGDEAPDVDMKKVNAVRASIAQGTYKVNAEAIADKMLSNAQEMLTRSRG